MRQGCSHFSTSKNTRACEVNFSDRSIYPGIYLSHISQYIHSSRRLRIARGVTPKARLVNKAKTAHGVSSPDWRKWECVSTKNPALSSFASCVNDFHISIPLGCFFPNSFDPVVLDLKLSSASQHLIILSWQANAHFFKEHIPCGISRAAFTSHSYRFVSVVFFRRWSSFSTFFSAPSPHFLLSAFFALLLHFCVSGLFALRKPFGTLRFIATCAFPTAQLHYKYCPSPKQETAQRYQLGFREGKGLHFLHSAEDQNAWSLSLHMRYCDHKTNPCR